MKQATIYNATIWYQEGNYFLKANRTFFNKKCKEKRAQPMHTSIKHNAIEQQILKIKSAKKTKLCIQALNTML